MSRLCSSTTLLSFCLLSTALFGQETPFDSAPEHIVLVSIDGLRPEFYLDAAWPAPTIQQMARKGVHARKVRGVFPSVTYPSHTTMITGALPARHGIFNNSPFEPGGQTGRWYWEEAQIQVETLWDAVAKKGGKSAGVSWPVTVGAPIDYNLPEYWSLDSKITTMDLIQSKSTPSSLWDELESQAVGDITDEKFGIDYMARDDTAGQIAAYILGHFQPSLLAVHLTNADHFQHQVGRQGDIVHRAIASVDRAIGRIMEEAEVAGILNKTAFVITGDHGFVDVHTTIAPNVWLAGAGLVEEGSDRGNWRATFHTSGGSALLYLRDRDDQAAVEEVRQALAKVEPRYQRFFRIVDRLELDRIGTDPAVPFALTAHPGFAFTSSAAGSAIRAGGGGTHGYFPELDPVKTGFIGWGAGFQQSRSLPEIGLEDIAPLIAHLLDLDFEAPDGVFYSSLVQ